MNDITEQEMTRYFSNNLRLLRNGRTSPISQQQLANQLHVDRGLIAKYECGLLLPPVHLAFLISRYFKIPMEALLAKPLRTTRKEICT